MNWFRSWVPALVWMAIIFVLSGRQSVSVSQDYFLNFLFFKTLHVIEYAILYILYARALYENINNKVVDRYATAFLLTIIYAISDEIHQTFVPSREGRVRDVIIDGIGAGLAWIFLQQWLPKAPKKLRNWAKRWDILS